MSTVDDLAKQILADVVADFRAKNLGSQTLNDGYVGGVYEPASGVAFRAEARIR